METSDLPELTPESLRAMSRMMIFFAVAGVVVGIVGVIAVEWVLATIPDQFGTLPTLTPMVIMFVIATLAPAIAILVGAREGPRGASRRILGEVAVGSWIGSVIYAGIALLIVGLVALQSDVGPTFLEYFSLAGHGLPRKCAQRSCTPVRAASRDSTSSAPKVPRARAISAPPPTEEPEPEPEPAPSSDPEPAPEPDPKPDEESAEEDDDGPEESPFSFD
ncbi:MAG: hypothetical protein U5K37_01905 [Natrialbaceae archaeon]|nr:hypothetical protein [Natrialbaceae archaeon]